jgi:hypothetical protein
MNDFMFFKESRFVDKIKNLSLFSKQEYIGINTWT